MPIVRGISRSTYTVCIQNQDKPLSEKVLLRSCAIREKSWAGNLDHSPMFITSHAIYNQEQDYKQAAVLLISSQRQLCRPGESPAPLTKEIQPHSDVIQSNNCFIGFFCFCSERPKRSAFLQRMQSILLQSFGEITLSYARLFV